MRSPSIGLCGLAIILLALASCDEASPSLTGGTPPAAASPAPTPAAAEADSADEGRKVDLSESDFVESSANRDPFRPYLKEFLTPQQRTAKIQRKVILQRYGLDELQLIAVVAGRSNPLAMFRDPNGLGVTVKRGDYISKSAGRVKQILPDKVVVEIQEKLEDGESVADRVIDLHPKDTEVPVPGYE